jgi:hypothetical protein
VDGEQLLLCLLELILEAGDDLLVGLVGLFKLEAIHGEFLHGLLGPELVLGKHRLGCPELLLLNAIHLIPSFN